MRAGAPGEEETGRAGTPPGNVAIPAVPCGIGTIMTGVMVRRAVER